MKYSTRTRYGLRLLVYMALKKDDGFIQLREVEKHEGVSLRYLEQIVRLLKPSGVLISSRGKYGGYRLSRSPDEIWLSDVVGYLEGDLAPVSCLSPGHECSRRVDCPTLPMWQELQEVITGFLRGKSLADLAHQYRVHVE